MTQRISYRFCDRCACRRRFYRSTRGDFGVLRCSQGHVTTFAVATFEKAQDLLRTQLVPRLIEYFQSPAPFYRALRGR